MDMFLTGLCLSLLGMAVCVALFATATQDERRHESRAAEKIAVPLPASQFFVDDRHPAATAPRVPLEALLLQLESHIRLEQAAAESFLHLPTSETLYSPTQSPLANSR